MYLVSAHIRNVRIHRELRVDFDRERNLIAGPNETGKSTLAEAVHRALFLKAKGSAEAHRHLESDLFDGVPSVEVTFAVHEDRWTIRKEFSGTKGASVLTGPDGSRYTGDEAEARLADLLQADLPDGRLSGEKMNAHWSHLWVWQGSSGNQPAEALAPHQQAIIDQLETLGGAGILQSEADREAAEAVQTEYQSLFTGTGKVASGSELAKLQARRDALQEEVKSSEAKLRAIQEDLNRLADCRDRLASAEQARPDLEKEQAAIRKRQHALAELDDQRRQKEEPLRLARERVQTLKDAEKRIHDLTDRIAQGEAALKPLDENRDRQSKALEGIALSLKTVRTQITGAREARQEAQRRYKILDQQQQLMALRSQAERTAGDLKRLEGEERQLREDKARLAALDGINEAFLEKLRDLQKQVERAQTTLETVSTRIELKAGSQPVLLDDQTLVPHEPQVIREAADLSLGDTRVRIVPGGGSSLEEASEALNAATSALNERLAAKNLKDLAEAEKQLQVSIRLADACHERERRISEYQPEDLRRRFENDQQAIRTLEASVNQQIDEGSDALPDTAEALADALKAAQETLEERESEVQKLESQRDRREDEDRAIRVDLDKTHQELSEKKADLKAERLRLEEERSTHGAGEDRKNALFEASQVLDQLTRDVTRLQEQRQSLNPDFLKRDAERNEEALKRANESVSQAKQELANIRGRLESPGIEDPSAILEEKQGLLEKTQSELQRMQREADAVRLLKELFDREQKALADRLSAPLADALTGYIRTLFPRARAVIEVNPEQIQGIRLLRDHPGAFEFEQLSGGTREQLAAAVRLAAADILAQRQDGCLPVVFDDAFAFADKSRIRDLQRMLDHAASRGLQVIVLTCSPDDYAGFPARTINLSRQAPAMAGELSRRPAPVAADAPEAAPAPQAPADRPDTRPQPAASGEAPDLAAPSPANPQADALLAALRDLGGKAGNTRLREALNWDPETYDRIRDQLVDEGILAKGRGRGGSVSLVE